MLPIAKLFAAIIALAGLIGLRPAEACDDRIAGACKGYSAQQNTETGLSVSQPTARRSSRSSRRGYARSEMRQSRAERRRARAEARREAREARTQGSRARRETTEVAEESAAEMKIPRQTQPGEVSPPLAPGHMVTLPDMPKIGSTFVPAAPAVIDSPLAVSALPLPNAEKPPVATAAQTPQEPTATAAPSVPPPATTAQSAPPAAAAAAPVQNSAPTQTAQPAAKPTPRVAAAANPAANTGAAPTASPVMASSSHSGEGETPVLRYAMLAFAGLLVLGTIARMAFG